ncbi:MAG: PAS domain-containing sensor histidine kinase [Candidatus Omnitrophica bacterium]|nr:PAS domain-containing sensor histidine kinase [Candidatus Omnitrophota bacterium]MDD5237341.1 PAS domain-containing sensor histidine kinase [Candidatus Omnitrophota bacterium]
MKGQKKSKKQLIKKIKHSHKEIKNPKKLEVIRKRLEEKLQISEVRFRRLFETAHDGILILDFETGQITEVNPFLTDLLDYKRNDFLGKKLWEIGAFKDIELSKAAFRELQTKGYVRYDNLPLQAKDGRIIEVEFVSNTYTIDHKKVIQCNIRDTTEQMRLERIKEGITKKVFHEVRNPLSIAKMGLDLILNKIAGDINKDQEKMLGVINNAIERVIRITTELLDFSKLEAGKINLQQEPINAHNLVKEVVSFFELAIKEKGLEVRLKLPEKEINIYSDKDKIFQAISNLIGNATKFTEKGYIEVSVCEKEDCVEFSVLDTGRGISQDDLHKIFGKFEQFGEILKNNDKGIGLGLAITKDIVELSKGKIWVESELGKGTKFSFTIPKFSPLK